MLSMIFINTVSNDDDREFIEHLYKTYYPIMKKKAYEITNEISIVDDLINEAFISIIGKISTIRALDCCKRATYIVYTIKNTAINYVNSRSAKQRKMFYGIDDDLMSDIPDLSTLPEDIISIKESYDELGKVLMHLSDRDRDLLYFKYLLELSDQEISRKIGTNSDNVRMYLTRARRRALNLLKKEGLLDGEG